MKSILIVFCLFLVAVSADSAANTTIDIERKITNLLTEVAKIAKDDDGKLTNEAKEYYSRRENQLEQIRIFLSDINMVREVNETCVAAQDGKIYDTINNMFYNAALCNVKGDNSLAINATVLKLFLEPNKEAHYCAIKAVNSAINELVDIRESIHACKNGL